MLCIEPGSLGQPLIALILEADLIYFEGVVITSSRENIAYKAFTSLPCAQNTGGESPCIDTQDGLKASDCGRLGRQAAGHPWSALRVVKSCRKDCPTASVLPKPKQQLCIQSGTRAHYLNYLQEVGEAEKRSAGNRIGYQVIDRQVEDRQTERSKQGR